MLPKELENHRFERTRLQLVDGLAGAHFEHFNAEIGDAAAQFLSSSGEQWERAEVHRDDDLRAQKLARVGGFVGTHGEDVADGDHGDLRRVELVDDVHVTEDVGVTGVVNLHASGGLEHVSASFAAVDHLTVVFDSAGVVGVDHGDANIGDRGRAAFVHREDVLCALLCHPLTELIDADNGGLVLPGEFDGVSDVVSVAVGAEHDVDLVERLLVSRSLRVVHDPGVDEEDFVINVEAEGGVPEPGDLGAGEGGFHRVLILKPYRWTTCGDAEIHVVLTAHMTTATQTSAGLRVMISREEIAKRVHEIGEQINKDYAGEKVVLVGVLKGSCLFLSDLARQISLDTTFDFIAVSSYGQGKQSSGEVKLSKDVDTSLQGKNVIIVEDILDTGLTLTYLTKLIEASQPKSLKVAALLDKPSRRLKPIQADYFGFKIPDEFVVGYGMDYAERYRNLPDICVLENAEA